MNAKIFLFFSLGLVLIGGFLVLETRSFFKGAATPGGLALVEEIPLNTSINMSSGDSQETVSVLPAPTKKPKTFSSKAKSNSQATALLPSPSAKPVLTPMPKPLTSPTPKPTVFLIQNPTPSPLPVTPTPTATPLLTPAVTATPTPQATASPAPQPTPTVIPITPTPTPSQAVSNVSHVLISELFIDMAGSDTQEFVELYNPTGTPIDLSGWSLQYLSGSASSFGSVAKKNFVSGATIPALGFYLIGVGGYAGSISADMTWSQSLNNTAATVFLVNDQSVVSDQNDSNIMDRVGYGSGSGVFAPEGNPASLPPEGQTIERKAYQSGCVSAQGSGESFGNGCDANDNGADFEIRSAPNPQNSQNPTEPY